MLITTGTCYEFTLGREGHWPPATLQDRFERLYEKKVQMKQFTRKLLTCKVSLITKSHNA